MKTKLDPAGFASAVIDACSGVVALDPGGVDPPNSLYHFTDVNGLMGIFASKCLRASLATALNDAAEVRHGVEVAKAVVLDRLKAGGSEFERVLLTQLEEPASPHFGMSFEISAFVVSFCARCDKSGQWLHYGRDGEGFAIGFVPAVAEAVSYDVRRIDYSIDSQRARMRMLVDAAQSLLHRQASGPSTTWMAEAAAHLVSMYVPILAASMKHPSFVDEEEWRLIGVDTRLNGTSVESSASKREMKWRIAGQRLIPFEELSFAGKAREVVSEIVVGYSAPSGLDSIRVLASEHGVEPVVRRSEVPVR